VVKDLSVHLKKLPAELSGFTLVHLSDLHLGTLTPVGRLRWIVDRVNHMSPDLVVITGDLIDRDISQDEEFCEPLGEIRARYGVVAVPATTTTMPGTTGSPRGQPIQHRNPAQRAAIDRRCHPGGGPR